MAEYQCMHRLSETASAKPNRLSWPPGLALAQEDHLVCPPESLLGLNTRDQSHGWLPLFCSGTKTDSTAH